MTISEKEVFERLKELKLYKNNGNLDMLAQKLLELFAYYEEQKSQLEEK